jgi:hypothetical protein
MLATSSPASETGSIHRKYIVQSAGPVRQPRRSKPAYVFRRDSFLFRMALYCCQVIKGQQQKAAASPPSQLTLLLNCMQHGDPDAAEQAWSGWSRGRREWWRCDISAVIRIAKWLRLWVSPPSPCAGTGSMRVPGCSAGCARLKRHDSFRSATTWLLRCLRNAIV